MLLILLSASVDVETEDDDDASSGDMAVMNGEVVSCELSFPFSDHNNRIIIRAAIDKPGPVSPRRC